MDVETKLRRFSDVVLKEASEMKKKQLGVIEEKHEQNVEDFQRRIETKYKEMQEDAAITSEQQKQKLITQKSAEIKKALIQKRKGYIDVLFNNVQKRLEDYFKTPEYEQHIVDEINKYKDASPDGITAYIMQRDAAFKDSIAKKTGVTVLTTDEEFLGGVKILLDKNRIADCTLRHIYEHEKAGFNKIKII